MSDDRLRCAIEALLRPYLRGLAARRRPRLAVLGATSVGRVDTRAPGPGPVWPGRLDPPGTGLRIEPGLLSWSGASPTLPLSIWTTADLRSWLAGSGVAIPGTDPPVFTHLVGRVVAVAGSGLVWPDDPPLGAVVDGAYPSAGYASAAAIAAVCGPPPAARLSYPAQAYSGELRRWAEACLAAGRSLGTRLPAGLSLDASAGLVWLATGTAGAREPWAVAIGPGGVRAYRMRVSELTAPLAEWVWTGAVTGIARDLAWLYVLADLERIAEPGAGDVVTLLDSAAMAEAYADGATPLIMPGWDWSPVAVGGAWQAALVVASVDLPGQYRECFSARQCLVTLAVSGSAPVASLNPAVAAGRFRPNWGIHKLWYGPADGLGLLRNGRLFPPADPPDTDPVAPVACAWTADGTLQTLNYYRYGLRSVTTESSGGGIYGCSAGGTETSATGSIGIQSGGYGVVAPPDVVVGSGTRTERHLAVADDAWGSWNSGSYLTSQDYNVWSYWGNTGAGCGISPEDLTAISHSGRWILQSRSGLVTMTQTDHTVSDAAGMQYAVYLPAERALWLVGGARGTSRSDRVQVLERRERTGKRCGDSLPFTNKVPPFNVVAILGEKREGIGWDTWNAVPVSDDTTSSAAWSEMTAILWAGGALLALGTADPEDWDYLGGDGTGEAPSAGALTALISARGSAIWSASPSASRETDSGIPPAALAAARSWAGG